MFAWAATVTFAALGLAVTRVCATPETASTIGPFSAVILSFVSGAFIPLEALPNWLRTVGKVFPLEHLAIGMQRGLIAGATGTGITAFDMAVLGAWAAAGLVGASLFFRWEPRSAA